MLIKLIIFLLQIKLFFSYNFCEFFNNTNDINNNINIYSKYHSSEFNIALYNDVSDSDNINGDLYSINLLDDSFINYIKENEIIFNIVSNDYINEISDELTDFSSYPSVNTNNYKDLLRNNQLEESNYCLPGFITTDIIVYSQLLGNVYYYILFIELVLNHGKYLNNQF